MLERFFPDDEVGAAFDVDLCELRARGVRAILLDVDNTLVRPGKREPEGAVLDWLKRASDAGFLLCALSNARRRRDEYFVGVPGMKYVERAKKPSRRGFARALEATGVTSDQACMIGDQVFTDIYGARRSGVYAILVRPFAFFETFAIVLKRVPEFFVLRRYRRYRRGKGSLRRSFGDDGSSD